MTSTSRAGAGYRCTQCGTTSIKWAGRCGGCQQWGTVEPSAAPGGRARPGLVAADAVPIQDVPLDAVHPRPTGVGEFDRVLGGGLVPGSVVLMAGEPGIGKSTLLLDVAARTARQGAVAPVPGPDRPAAAGVDSVAFRSDSGVRASGQGGVLYVCAEESAAQVRARAERIGALAPRLLLAAETDLESVLALIDANRPLLVVVDSVQTVASGRIDGPAGSVSQVREVTAALTRAAKQSGHALILVGHVTKDGSIAGPRSLEHLVDVVVSFEGDRHSRLRMVRGVKNRYGPTDEVGCFELGETGAVGVSDPSALFTGRHDHPVPGTCLTIALEGRRPLVCEVQALVAQSGAPQARRATSGVDAARAAMICAVLDKRAGLPVAGADCYLATVGGARIGEPAGDLAIALAVASSLRDEPMPAGAIAVGEVGLAGDIRPVSGLARRLAEAERLGYTLAYVPAGMELPDPASLPSLTVHPVSQLGEAVARIFGGQRRLRQIH